MPLPASHRKIQYRQLGAGDLRSCARLIAGVFSRDEPLAVAAGQSREELENMLLTIGPSALGENCSYGAWDGTELVGAALATAFTWAPPDGAEALSPSYPPIGAIIGELEAAFETQPRERLQRCLHIHMLAVSQQFRSYRIAEKLVQNSIDVAATRGFQEAITDATNPASQQVFRKAGFAQLTEVRYADFDFDGNHIFDDIENAAEIALMWRAI